MKYIINSNTELVKKQSIWLLMNFENQAVIGLDKVGMTFWEHIKKDDVCYEEIANNKELYDSLFELDFLKLNYKIKERKKISSAYVHLLNRCNLNCLGCYSMNDKRNKEVDASTDKWKLAFVRLAQAGVGSVVISGGEPLLRKDIVELLQFAKSEAKIESITLITNGTVDFPFEQLKNCVDVVAVSVDGYDKEHATFIRNEGIFEKIMQTVSRIRDAGIEVCIVPTLHMKNYEAMELYDRLAEKLQVSLSFSILSVPCDEVFKEYILDDAALSKIADDIISLNADVDDMITAGEGLCASKSFGLGQNMVSIDDKGNIYPCHILHDDDLLLGNIFDNPLEPNKLNLEVMNKCKKANVDNIEGCKSCEHKYLCGGGCRGRAYLKNRDLLAGDSYCNLFRKFHDNQMRTILQEIENAG